MNTVYGRYGKYTVYLVDEEEVRNQSLKLEEFTNYAIHSDFPEVIPETAIWLSRRTVPEERFILVNEALHRIKYEKQGMSETQAYNKALKLDKILRDKMLWSRHIIDPTNNKPNQDIYLSKYGRFKDIDIWIVDGVLVRSIYKTDFVEGGHDYVYNFIPRGEIWIDAEVPKEERVFIACHEIAERVMMKDKHFSYDKAHDKASRIEWRFRSKKD